MDYRFEWDAFRAKANVAKHGVTFKEAQTIFTDRWAVEIYDRKHSIDEERLIVIGMSDHNRVLVVAFTRRDHETIRIIQCTPSKTR
jgi:uncharacterized DUF497 family protein